MRIIHHVYISYLESPHFSIISAFSGVSVRRSEAQPQLKQPQTKKATPPASSAPSTSAPSSSAGGVTLKAVIVQLQRMDAHLDTLTTKMYQVNTHVGHIE